MIQLGIDRFNPASLKGKRVALLCHASSVNSKYTHLTEICAQAQLNVVRCFGPEHGIWADAQDMEAVVEEGIEPHTQAPVTSLYGHTVEELTPNDALFDEIDILVIDLQDIGSRYYTYIYTAALCAQVCGRTQTQVLILDRPNPLGGEEVEGGLTRRDYQSFVGLWPLPTRHGLTLAEVVCLLNDREGFNADIEVIQVQGWQRHQLLNETGQRWVQPSPNMPSFHAMMVYPGLCLIEGTEMSEGRGTTRPFEWIGASYIHPFEYAKALNQRDLKGIHFRPLYFKPTFHKYAHQTIGGVELHITNLHALRPLKVGLHLLDVTRRLYGEHFQWRTKAYEYITEHLAIDLLFGGPQARQAIDQGTGVDQVYAQWEVEADAFKESRRPYLRY
jgi:uncharacterized protein YbbC (DUF1343 family)